jgi:Tol biopolymer transport system component
MVTILLIGGILGEYWLNKQDAPSALMQINRATTSSNASETAISPDGKFVTYVLGEFGKQSLWIKEVATSQVTPLTPPEEKRYRGLAFSPDGHSLYFSQRENSESELVLYQLQLRGGAIKKILTGVDSAVSFSPDGSRLVFVREDKTQGESSLIIANADGSGERRLSSRKLPEFYSVDGPSWSPDGKIIAVAVSTSAKDFHYRIMLIWVDSGKEQPLGEQMWAWAMRVFWLADGSGLVMLARDKTSGRNSQVWQLSYPAGKAHKIINDLNDYRCLSISADSKKLVTIQSEVRSDIWVVPLDNADQPIQITNNPTGQNGYDGLDWSPDGNIVYTSVENGQQNLWIMNADARMKKDAESRPKQLTNDMGINDHYPSVSGDGRYVVYASSKSGRVHLWRIDIDGANPKELTDGNLDLKPNCSPDGQWIVYSTEKIGTSAARKISRIGIDGGQAVRLTEKLSEFPVVSPDGKLVACIYQEDPKWPRKIALIPFEGGEPVQTLKIPFFARPTVHWHPNGKALSYLTTQDESSDIWLWPLSGKAPAKFTNFNSERIFAYSWSRDGRYLACARGKANRDVVMVTGFK